MGWYLRCGFSFICALVVSGVACDGGGGVNEDGQVDSHAWDVPRSMDVVPDAMADIAQGHPDTGEDGMLPDVPIADGSGDTAADIAVETLEDATEDLLGDVFADTDIGPTACTEDQDCDDGNPCMENICDPELGCVSTPADGVNCDDGLECSTDDLCFGGICVGTCMCATDEDCEGVNTVLGPCDSVGCYESFCVAIGDPTLDGTLCDDGIECTLDDVCFEGLCTGVWDDVGCCEPSCLGKDCGDDGCGGSCGLCEGPQDLCEEGLCVCQPACDGKDCGDDGCGGNCGLCLGAQDLCEEGLCVCQPACDGKECGDDGCGGDCGTCGELICGAFGQCMPAGLVPTTCNEAHGPTGCCGSDGAVYWFEGGALQGAPGNCTADVPCGWDASNNWYSCNGNETATEDPSGTFPAACGLPNPAPGDCPNCSCDGKECGDDGCGLSCGECLAAGTVCNLTTQMCVAAGALVCDTSDASCTDEDPCLCHGCLVDGRAP